MMELPAYLTLPYRMENWGDMCIRQVGPKVVALVMMGAGGIYSLSQAARLGQAQMFQMMRCSMWHVLCAHWLLR